MLISSRRGHTRYWRDLSSDVCSPIFALVWGYVLGPYELVAGLGGPLDLASWRATQLVSPLLVGVALATAGLSAAWALRPRHALAAAGWIVLSFASLVEIGRAHV